MKSPGTRPVSSRVLDAAINWQLCLGVGSVGSREQAEFALWLAADAEHARAWRQLGMLDQRFTGASAPARAALLQGRENARLRLRKLGGLAGVVLVSGLALLTSHRYLPLDYWLADQRTATGEQRSVLLDDNTLVRLNTHSAIDIRFDGRERRVVLEEGEILVETGSHSDPRPFIVETTDGRLHALGTRFLVRRESRGTLLSVLQSAVAARSRVANDEQIVHEGQQVLINHDGLGPMVAVAPGTDAWVHGMLVVDNARLGDLVDELARYRHGYLSVSPEVADLRVTGSFPLGNTDLALQALLPTLPVRIEQRGPWWVNVLPRSAKASIL